MMVANEPETALYRAPNFSLLLAPHGGISSCIAMIATVINPRRACMQRGLL